MPPVDEDDEIGETGAERARGGRTSATTRYYWLLLPSSCRSPDRGRAHGSGEIRLGFELPPAAAGDHGAIRVRGGRTAQRKWSARAADERGSLLASSRRCR